MLLSNISFFLFNISLANSLSFYNELRNFALASYSYLSDSYSANRFVLKSAKSLADLISCSSSALIVSLNLSINDYTIPTISLINKSANSPPSPLLLNYEKAFSSSPNLTNSESAYSSKRLAYLLNFSAYSPTLSF